MKTLTVLKVRIWTDDEELQHQDKTLLTDLAEIIEEVEGMDSYGLDSRGRPELYSLDLDQSFFLTYQDGDLYLWTQIAADLKRKPVIDPFAVSFGDSDGKVAFDYLCTYQSRYYYQATRVLNGEADTETSWVSPLLPDATCRVNIFRKWAEHHLNYWIRPRDTASLDVYWVFAFEVWTPDGRTLECTDTEHRLSWYFDRWKHPDTTITLKKGNASVWDKYFLAPLPDNSES